jgi:hypothetical protein
VEEASSFLHGFFHENFCDWRGFRRNKGIEGYVQFQILIDLLLFPAFEFAFIRMDSRLTGFDLRSSAKTCPGVPWICS